MDLILLRRFDFTWAQVAFSSSESTPVGITVEKENPARSPALIVPHELLFLHRRIASSSSAPLFPEFVTELSPDVIDSSEIKSNNSYVV